MEKNNSHVTFYLHFYLASFTCLLLAIQFFDMRNASDVTMFASSRGKLRETPRYQNLWDLIVNNDDICFKHVLPRLNPTDLKFLYEVNTETRKLVKRSSRKGELKKTFKVKRCRRYRLWKLRGRINRCGRVGGDETYFCLKLLKRINSSCSSGRERRKSVSGIDGRLMRPQLKVIWKW